MDLWPDFIILIFICSILVILAWIYVLKLNKTVTPIHAEGV